MGNRATKRCVLRRLNVHVNKLVIFSAIGKRVDAILMAQAAALNAELGADGIDISSLGTIFTAMVCSSSVFAATETL